MPFSKQHSRWENKVYSNGPRPCAHCRKERGIESKWGESHGMCRFHELQELINHNLATPEEKKEFMKHPRNKK
jgi:hypothetical protein